jgi:sialic acid synthase SpsE
MLEIMNKFEIKSGLSDHSNGISASIAAITLGASYIEKHVVYSKSMFGPDTSSSIEFKDLKRLRGYIDDFQKLVIPIDKDKEILNLQEMRMNFGRSLSFKKSLKMGEVPSQEDFCLRKPAGGFTWADRLKFLGKPLKKDFTNGDLIRMEHFYE